MHDAIEMTHWSIEQIEATPAVTLDRLLLIHRAKDIAKPPRQVWWKEG